MRSKAPARKPAVAPPPALPVGPDAADIAALRNSLDSFRREHADEIGRVVSALRDRPILAGVDSTDYRPGAARAAVEEKIAEAIVETLLGLEDAAAIRSERDTLRAKVERRRDAHRRAASALKKAHPRRAAVEEAVAASFADIARSLTPIGGGLMRRGEHLDSLTVKIVAIFDHATVFKPHHVLKEIAPDILAATWASYPACAPRKRRGEDHPLARYKRAIKRIVAGPVGPFFMAPKRRGGFTADDHLLHRRAILFAGDRRFPTALFLSHRRRRTVAYRSAPIPH
jgi:hypothetical protein